MSPAQLLQSLVRQQSFKSVTLFILPAILSDCNTGIRTRVKEDGQEKYIFNTRNIKAMKLNQFVTVEGTAGNETLIQDKQRGPCCLPLNQMLSLLSSPAPSPWALKYTHSYLHRNQVSCIHIIHNLKSYLRFVQILERFPPLLLVETFFETGKNKMKFSTAESERKFIASTLTKFGDAASGSIT